MILVLSAFAAGCLIGFIITRWWYKTQRNALARALIAVLKGLHSWAKEEEVKT